MKFCKYPNEIIIPDGTPSCLISLNMKDIKNHTPATPSDHLLE